MKTNQSTNLVLDQDFDGAIYEELETSKQAKLQSEQPSDRAAAIAKWGTTSGAIRALTSLGWKRGDIAKFLNIKYQFVRNVQVTPIGKRTELK
jgi:hypothetical protein